MNRVLLSSNLRGFKLYLVGAISYSAQNEPPTVKKTTTKKTQNLSATVTINSTFVLFFVKLRNVKMKCWRSSIERILLYLHMLAKQPKTSSGSSGLPHTVERL